MFRIIKTNLATDKVLTMKKILLFLLFVNIFSLGKLKAQFSKVITPVDMPEGHGTDMGRVNKQVELLFEYNGFLYCKSRAYQNYFETAIFKVNMSNDEVTKITWDNLNPAYSEIPHQVEYRDGTDYIKYKKIYNGEIYFLNVSDGIIYKISPNTNKIYFLTYFNSDFEILNNQLISLGGENSEPRIFNLDHLELSYIAKYITPDTDEEYSIHFTENAVKVDNTIYAIGNYVGTGVLAGKKLFKIEAGDYPTLKHTILYNFDGNVQFDFFKDNNNKPYYINNKLFFNCHIFNYGHPVKNKIISYDLSSNVFTDSLYVHDVDNERNFPTVSFKNNLYINNSKEVSFITDGSVRALQANLNIYNYNNFCSDIEPFNRGDQKGASIVEYNNSLFGMKNSTLGRNPYETWKTNMLTNTSLNISTSLNLWSARIHKDNFFALGYDTQEPYNYGFYQKVYKFNDQTNSFDDVGHVGGNVTSYGRFTSPIFAYNNSIYVTADVGDYRGSLNGNLYKLDLSGVVPIKLIEFKTVYKNNKVELKWKTTSEIINQGFDVERSINGIDFKKLSFISGNYTTQTAQNYSYIDEYPPIQNQTIYYRLKQIDTNGNFEYSEILQVKVAQLKQATFAVFPNPVTSNLITISLNNLPISTYHIAISNMAGLTINQANLIYKGGSLSKTLDLNLPAGVYILEISSALYHQAQKLVVQ